MSLVHDITMEVIRAAGRAKPADQALRDVLKRYRTLPPFDAAEISRAVFAHYRWHAWLRDERTVEARMRLCRRLQERFAGNPGSFPSRELQSKAVPAWVAQEMDVPDEWLRQLQQEPTLWLRAKRGTASILRQRLHAAEVSDLLPDALAYRGETDLFKTPEFHAGDFEIQDIASQAVGWLCNPRPGETWWDACAGEGGKTMHLSDLMQNKGLIWASDRAEWRLRRLKRRAGRAGVFNYRTALWDGGEKPPTKTRFDGVLVDAPCSGLGTWQRNPHARWTTKPEDVRELSAIQRQLLDHVAGCIKPGGRLIYAVCTLTKAETTGIADQFTAAHREFEPLLMSLPPGPSAPQQSGSTRMFIWPQDLGGNGMFVAGWERVLE